MEKQIEMRVYKKIYKEILMAVSEEIECEASEIIKGKSEDCFCARMALCWCMSAHITDAEISKLTGLSQQVISRNKILYPARQKQSMTIRLLSGIITSTIKRKIEEYKQSTSETQQAV